MRTTLALFAVLLLAAGASAACLDNGHYTMVASPSPLTGTDYPYTEDLASRPDQLPIGDGLVVAYHDDLRWTKVQSGCADSGERNVIASTDVNLLLRASFDLAYASRDTAVDGTRYEVQLRLDDAVVLDEVHPLAAPYPRSQRFGTVVRNVAAGVHRYSMWLRLLDGPDTNRVTLGLQWITAQGVPRMYPTLHASRDAQRVTETWTPLTDELPLAALQALDLAFVSSIDVARADDDAKLVVAWSVDRRRIDGRALTLAATGTLFDQRPRVTRGIHTLRLWARTTHGTIDLADIRANAIAFPLVRGRVVPLMEARDATPLEVTGLGDAVQPETMVPICGRWTKLLDFDTRPSDGDFSWLLHGYVELSRAIGNGYIQIGIQAIRSQADPDSHGNIERTDMGILQAQVEPGGTGVSFYGDCSAWGNSGGTHMSLWIRLIEGCNDAPFGGTLSVGTRWVAIKLFPSSNIHIP
ncbi:MAG: hypothetical protein JO197_21455 [Acidobacteria bacterium]|nr:hypothetical protein [Acidobacteriota bacterium]